MGDVVATSGGGVALRSAVSWALLGIVIQRPSYGYELVQRFERTFGDALELSSLSQIYTALDTLTRRSLIEKLALDDQDSQSMGVRQPKPHYRATAEGVQSYERWLVGQIAEERRRSRLFARQLSVLPPQTALAIVERCERACLDEAKSAADFARPERLPATGAEEPVEGSAGLAQRLLGEEGRLAVEARLAWLAYARRELTSLAAAPHAPPPTTKR